MSGSDSARWPGTLPGHGRFGYSPITRRPDWHWPGGARLAVYLGFNLEHFAFGEGLGAAIGPASPQPDVLNYSWREYGNRVGAWRCLELFDQLGLPTAAIVNTALYDHCPELVAACVARGDEIVGHGHSNSERQGSYSEGAERELLASCHARIARESGTAPSGWLSPWISESLSTPDLLVETGYSYTLNWCHDDQPMPMRTRSGQPLWAVPYPQELNDIPMIVARQLDGKDFAQMIIDQLDEMLEQSKAPGSAPLVMGIALHPYIVGQPYRLRHLRRALQAVAAARDAGQVWMTTPGAICRHAAGVLLGLGHRRIALLNRETRRAGDVDSEAGFFEGVKASSVQDVTADVAYHRDDVETVARALARLLDRKNPPTALVVSNSYAYLATTSLLAQRGLRIPRDISLISRDDDPFLGSLAPAPARYIVSPHAFAKKMIGPLLQLVARDPVVRTRAPLLPKIAAGGSMARLTR